MRHMADFARPMGAKDKQKRKNRRAMLIGGTVGGILGGVSSGISTHDRAKDHYKMTRGYLDNLSDKQYIQELAKDGLTKGKLRRLAIGYGGVVNAGLGVLAGRLIQGRINAQQEKRK